MEQGDEPTVRVKDRRRFDAEGNPRQDAEAEPPTASSEPPTAPRESPPAAPVPSALELENQRLLEELETTRKRMNDLAWAVKNGEREREEFKQRLQRERDQLMDLERAKAATALLEAVDELELCLKAAPADNALSQGVRLIRDGIVSRLQQSGLERLEVVGRTFDPNEHEAADMEITGHADDDQKITAEVRAGYRFKGRLVRPARVKVARYVQPANA
jgi:molecular chaperone GrpE